MAKFAIKRDGTKEPFDAEKIKASITGAASDAGLPEERTNEVTEQVLGAVMQMAEEKEEIPTSEIKEKILSELDVLEPSVSKAWKEHEQKK